MHGIYSECYLQEAPNSSMSLHRLYNVVEHQYCCSCLLCKFFARSSIVLAFRDFLISDKGVLLWVRKWVKMCKKYGEWGSWLSISLWRVGSDNGLLEQGCFLRYLCQCLTGVPPETPCVLLESLWWLVMGPSWPQEMYICMPAVFDRWITAGIQQYSKSPMCSCHLNSTMGKHLIKRIASQVFFAKCVYASYDVVD